LKMYAGIFWTTLPTCVERRTQKSGNSRVHSSRNMMAVVGMLSGD
jgi:hypothetical protein